MKHLVYPHRCGRWKINRVPMKTQMSKEERIELRVSSMDKEIFKRAQAISGDKTFSGFIIRIIRKHAEEIVAQNDRIISSEIDREVFFNAVFGDSKPNEQLIEAAKRYKAKTHPL